MKINAWGNNAFLDIENNVSRKIFFHSVFYILYYLHAVCEILLPSPPCQNTQRDGGGIFHEGKYLLHTSTLSSQSSCSLWISIRCDWQLKSIYLFHYRQLNHQGLISNINLKTYTILSAYNTNQKYLIHKKI